MKNVLSIYNYITHLCKCGKMESTCLVLWCVLALALSACALESTEDTDDEIKKIIGKYLSSIPDIESKHIVSTSLSNVIAQLFNGKISAFPLFRVSAKIDRNPVSIPWTLESNPAEVLPEDLPQHINKYKYLKKRKSQKAMDNSHNRMK